MHEQYGPHFRPKYTVPGLAAHYGGPAFPFGVVHTGALQGCHHALGSGSSTAHDVLLMPFDPYGLHLRDEHRQGSPPGKVLRLETYPHGTASMGRRKLSGAAAFRGGGGAPVT
jgi:hypothetical protein